MTFHLKCIILLLKVDNKHLEKVTDPYISFRSQPSSGSGDLRPLKWASPDALSWRDKRLTSQVKSVNPKSERVDTGTERINFNII